jgi:hypothetical protein
MPSPNDTDLSQYEEVLALEHECWITVEWNEPDTNTVAVTPSSSSLPSLSQEQDSASEGDSGAEEGTHASGMSFPISKLKKIWLVQNYMFYNPVK